MCLNVLLLEDQQSAAALTRLELSSEGITHVTQVKAVQEAVTAAASGVFDVAVLDLNVEDSQGVETLRTFRSRFPHMPTVVLSGRTGPPVMIELIRAGADETLQKDKIDAPTLGAAVMRAFLRHDPWGSKSNVVASTLLRTMTETIIE